MRPLTRALLFIILCYVIALNSIIINMLFRRYGHLMTWQRTYTFHSTTSELNVSASNSVSLPAKRHEPVCMRHHQLVVIVTQSRNSMSNDITKQVSLLTKLRTMLKDKHYESIHMFLAIDVDTFMPVHRSLCSNIPRCTLMLTMQNEVGEIFDQVSKVQPCIADIVLLTDRANIDPTFITRIGHTDETKVTCLLENKQGQPCPDIAYRIPRSFFTVHKTRAVDIMSTAAIEGVAAPPYAAFTLV